MGSVSKATSARRLSDFCDRGGGGGGGRYLQLQGAGSCDTFEHDPKIRKQKIFNPKTLASSHCFLLHTLPPAPSPPIQFLHKKTVEKLISFNSCIHEQLTTHAENRSDFFCLLCHLFQVKIIDIKIYGELKDLKVWK